MKAENTLLALVIGIAAAVPCACSDGGPAGKPQSIGQPYDVALTADDKAMERMAAGMFDQPMDALPQQETPFKVRTAGGTGQATRFMRNIVVIRKADKATKIKYEKEPFARGQLMVVVEARSAKALRADSLKVAKTLQRLIDDHEMKRAIEADRQHHNAKLMKEVEDEVECTITIPADMTMSKTGKGFVWVSDGGRKVMRNICIYATQGLPTSPQSLIDMRDSTMAKNIEGERKGMVMATERRTRLLFSRNRNSLTMRGLWHMKGDAMGGPFVSRTLVDSTRNRTVTAEAFVYAPSESKARAMKRLEAILNTLKLR